MSKPTTLTVKTPRAQTPVKSDDEKTEKVEKKAAEKKGPCALARKFNKIKHYDLLCKCQCLFTSIRFLKIQRSYFYPFSFFGNSIL